MTTDPGTRSHHQGQAWIASDLRHIVSRHTCVGGQVETVLPSIWKVDDLGVVRPSIQCQACGYHASPRLIPPPADAVMDVFAND